jgi:hypothetical protein
VIAFCRLLGWHRWRVTSSKSILFGVLITRRCTRCGDERTEAGW